jgi:zinc D-Ala-D-Ala carboxypeptidase
MRLTKNFTLQELTKSNTALRRGIDNTPDKEHIIKLRLLATHLLQPLRNAVGSIRITSGYRSPELCVVLGSKITSQHTKAEAIDCQYIKRGKMDNLKIYKALIDLDLDFDQCILEFGTPPPTANKDTDYPAWIHLSWKVNDNRRQTLVAYKDENNKTKYRPLIEYKSL